MRSLAWVTMLALSATVAWGQVDGTVFRDYNADGTLDALEVGVPLITVTAFLSSGGSVSTTTAANGTYAFTAVQIPATTRVRLELTGLPAYLQPGPFGADSGTTAVFATAPATTVDVGLNNPAHYCDDFPSEVVSACYVAGAQTGTDPIVISFPEDAGSASTVSSAAYDVPSIISTTISCRALDLAPTSSMPRRRSAA